MMEKAISIESVTQDFGVGFLRKKKRILHEVSFSFDSNRIIGLLGANGAGKTTLINLLVGIRKPTNGQIQVFRENIAKPSARSKVGFVPERPYFPEFLTGKEVLKVFGTLSGMKKKEIEKRSVEVLKWVGMEKSADTELKKYSKGMLQRIAIAQAILHEPELLVLDEPMSGLDPVGRREIRALISSLSKKGKTILFSTHITSDVEIICDEVILLKDGRLVAAGPQEKVLGTETDGTEIGLGEIKEDELREIWKNSFIEPIAAGFRIVAPKGLDLVQGLQESSQKGGKILWVQPVRPALDQIFLKDRER